MPDHIGKAVSSNESQSPGCLRLCTSERQDITAGQEEEEGLGGAQEKEEQTQTKSTHNQELYWNKHYFLIQQHLFSRLNFPIECHVIFPSSPISFACKTERCPARS